MKEFSRISGQMERDKNKGTYLDREARRFAKRADAFLESAQRKYARLVDLRNGILKDVLVERDLVICAYGTHAVRDGIRQGDPLPTEAQLGIVPSAEARLVYRHGITTSGGELRGIWKSLSYFCGEHVPKNEPTHALEEGSEPAYLSSEVRLAPDGQLRRVLDEVSVTKAIEGLDPIMDVLNQRNQGVRHRDMTIEIYRKLGIVDLPPAPSVSFRDFSFR